MIKENNKIEELVNQIFDTSKKASFDYTLESNSYLETNELGYYFAKKLNSSDILVLNGELGSGKTVFMSGIAKYFEIENQVSSPTFTIVNEYTLKDESSIYHFDVYRIESVDEFISDIGTEYFENGLCIIEWGNIIKEILPKNTIFIDISKDELNDNKRYFHIWRK